MSENNNGDGLGLSMEERTPRSLFRARIRHAVAKSLLQQAVKPIPRPPPLNTPLILSKKEEEEEDNQQQQQNHHHQQLPPPQQKKPTGKEAPSLLSDFETPENGLEISSGAAAATSSADVPEELDSPAPAAAFNNAPILAALARPHNRRNFVEQTLVLAQLRRLRFFRGFDDWIIKEIMETSRLQLLDGGTRLYSQGESVNAECYVIVRGLVNVHQSINTTSFGRVMRAVKLRKALTISLSDTFGPILCTLKVGDVVGHEAVVGISSRQSTIIIKEPTAFLVLHGETVLKTLGQYRKYFADFIPECLHELFKIRPEAREEEVISRMQNLLADSPPFSTLSTKLQPIYLRGCMWMGVKGGQQIIQGGSACDRSYYILSGSVVRLAGKKGEDIHQAGEENEDARSTISSSSELLEISTVTGGDEDDEVVVKEEFPRWKTLGAYQTDKSGNCITPPKWMHNLFAGPQGTDLLVFLHEDEKELAKMDTSSYFTSQWRKLLSVPPLDRTEEDISIVANMMLSLKFFQQLPSDVREELSAHTMFRTYSPPSILLLQGEDVTLRPEMYVLVNGSVHVHLRGDGQVDSRAAERAFDRARSNSIAKMSGENNEMVSSSSSPPLPPPTSSVDILAEDLSQSRIERLLGPKVAVLTKGDAFGEVALKGGSGAKRNASVIGTECVHVLLISNLLFKRTLDQRAKIIFQPDLTASSIQVPANDRTVQDLSVISRCLKSIALFHHMPVWGLEQLSKGVSLRVCNPSDIVVLQGEMGNELFIVLSGSLSIHKAKVNPRQLTSKDVKAMTATKLMHEVGVCVGVLAPGDCFGEGVLRAEGGVRAATVIARSASKLIVIDKELMLPLMKYVKREISFQPARLRHILKLPGDLRQDEDVFFIQRFLKRLKFLKDLKEEVLGELVVHLKYEKVERGSVIFNLGDVIDSYYIVLSGRVELFTCDASHVAHRYAPRRVLQLQQEQQQLQQQLHQQLMHQHNHHNNQNHNNLHASTATSGSDSSKNIAIDDNTISDAVSVHNNNNEIDAPTTATGSIDSNHHAHHHLFHHQSRQDDEVIMSNFFDCVAEALPGSDFGLFVPNNKGEMRRMLSAIATENSEVIALERYNFDAVMAVAGKRSQLEVKEFLSHISPFRNWSSHDLSTLASMFAIRKVEHGDVIYSRGETANSYFLIKSGSVNLLAISHEPPPSPSSAAALIAAGGVGGSKQQRGGRRRRRKRRGDDSEKEERDDDNDGGEDESGNDEEEDDYEDDGQLPEENWIMQGLIEKKRKQEMLALMPPSSSHQQDLSRNQKNPTNLSLFPPPRRCEFCRSKPVACLRCKSRVRGGGEVRRNVRYTIMEQVQQHGMIGQSIEAAGEGGGLSVFSCTAIANGEGELLELPRKELSRLPPSCQTSLEKILTLSAEWRGERERQLAMTDVFHIDQKKKKRGGGDGGKKRPSSRPSPAAPMLSAVTAVKDFLNPRSEDNGSFGDSGKGKQKKKEEQLVEIAFSTIPSKASAASPSPSNVLVPTGTISPVMQGFYNNASYNYSPYPLSPTPERRMKSPSPTLSPLPVRSWLQTQKRPTRPLPHRIPWDFQLTAAPSPLLKSGNNNNERNKTKKSGGRRKGRASSPEDNKKRTMLDESNSLFSRSNSAASQSNEASTSGGGLVGESVPKSRGSTRGDLDNNNYNGMTRPQSTHKGMAPLLAGGGEGGDSTVEGVQLSFALLQIAPPTTPSTERAAALSVVNRLMMTTQVTTTT